MTHHTELTAEQVALFNQQGFVKLEQFYNIESDIMPIWQGIYNIIGLLLRKYNIAWERQPFSAQHFDDGILALVQHNRSLGGVVYDAAKQIPAFIRLLASKRHEQIVRQLRHTNSPAVAAGGYGIRLDLPFEERFQAPWHQDFPNQLRSLDGVVFWSPLRSITPKLGPVKFCVGSHKEGALQVSLDDPRHPEKTGAYGMILANEADVIARYPWESPLSNPGDLFLIDYLTVHASTLNQSNLARWSMQLRYFNFEEPTGQSLNWCGSFAAGKQLSQLLPDLVIQEEQ